MSYPETFKEGFIKQIDKELNKCEIIYNPNTKGFWFINREEKYWYLEYKVESNYLWWRYEFFKLYTELLSMPSEVFQKLISEWVENKLNGKVLSTCKSNDNCFETVEDTLNCKVLSTYFSCTACLYAVEDTLNCKVLSTDTLDVALNTLVEDTLNCKVLSTKPIISEKTEKVEETLNCKVLTTAHFESKSLFRVEETLNLK